jgi:CHAT domain-containing protein
MVTRELMRDVSGQRLEETRQEAMTVAKGFGQPQVYEGPLSELPDGSGGSAVCVGYAANRPLAKSEGVGRCRHLLFSVHGQSDMSNPWLSSLMLTDLAAQPGRRQPAPLTMADVFGMKLSAQTVVLAACETAMGRIRSGEGVVGFQLAFLFAGAPTVVLTQWQIPSKVPMGPGKWAYPTTTVLTEFYRAMRERSVSRAEALRQGQLKVLHEQGALADPYFWGAWQLFGEWR